MTHVAIVGGGVYASVLCEALARRLPGGSLTLRLAARAPDRLALIAREAAARVKAICGGASVRAGYTLAEALEGADHVVLLVRVGGLAARAYDESFPRDEGIVGDEGLGPGGIANGWRTMPVLTEVAATIRACAPTAAVWNLVAPLGITTRCLLDAGVDAVGVCELPLVTRERWRIDTAALGYAGINHLGWFWPRTAAARAALEAAADVDGPTLRGFGAAPLHYYYEVFAKDAAARLGVTRWPGRAQALAVMADEALAAFRDAPGVWTPARATPWFDRALVPMVAARAGGADCGGYANVRNNHGAARWCDFASRDAVVELEVTVDRGGVRPRRADRAAPAPVTRWLAQVAWSEALAYSAARDRDPTALRQALAALPLPLTSAAVERLAARVERGPGGS